MKFKKVLFFTLIALFSTVIFSQSTLASTTDENSLLFTKPTVFEYIVDYENLFMQEFDGSITYFDSIEDMEAYLNPSYGFNSSDNLGLQPMSAVGKTLIGTEYKNFQFMGYSKFTKDWQKNSQYTTSKGESQTFSKKITTKWGDVSASFSYTEGVTRTIPADATRWSRLAGYADLKIERFKSSGHNFGTIYTTKVTKRAVYTDVRYK